MEIYGYIDREILLGNLALYLHRDIGEPMIIADDRLRQLAYKCHTREHITPEMDAEILVRVRRLRKIKQAARQ